MGVLLIYPWLKYLALGYAGQQIVARTAGFYSVSGFLYILGYLEKYTPYHRGIILSIKT